MTNELTKELTKKAEILQIRFEKTIFEQLSALALEEERPTSAMVRSWVMQRLKEEMGRVSSARQHWLNERVSQIRQSVNSLFRDDPILVIHGQPVTPNQTIKNLAAVQRAAPIIFPVSGIYQVSGRVNRLGYESVMEHNGKLINRSQIFRTSQVETVTCLAHQEQEILGLRLNEAIVLSIRNQINFFETQKFPWPYVFNISLLRLANKWLVTEATPFAFPHVGFQEDEMFLSDAYVTQLEQAYTDERLAQTIRPQLDEIWNASGYSISPDFDPEGNWHPPKR